MAEQQLFYPEAERLVEELREIPIPSYGTGMWVHQVETIMRLNTQAHSDAISNGGTGNSEEIIPEILLTKDKLEVLIHELISSEIYALKVHPIIKQQLRTLDSPRAGLLSYYESVLANLIEICVSSPYAHTGDELLMTSYKGLIDLVDWCVYRVRLLMKDIIDEVSPIDRKFEASNNNDNSNMFGTHPIQNSVESEKGNHKEKDNEYLNIDVAGADRTQLLILATSALSILRCICQVLSKLPLSVQSHVAREMDVPMLCCHLLLQKSPPWNRERKNKDGIRVFEYLQDGEWRSYKYPQERYVRITKIPGQLWVCLYSILSVENGQLYALNATRSQVLGQVAKLINQALADQLPFLIQLRGALESATMRYDQQMSAVNSIPGFSGASESRKNELENLYASMNDPSKGNTKVGLLNAGFVACEVAEIHESIEREIEEAARRTINGKSVTCISNNNNNRDSQTKGVKDGTVETNEPIKSSYEIVGQTILGILKSLSKSENQDDARRIAMLFGKQFEDAVGATAVQYCKGCGAEATMRCSRCKKEWYCGRKCQIKCWNEHKKVCRPAEEKIIPSSKDIKFVDSTEPKSIDKPDKSAPLSVPQTKMESVIDINEETKQEEKLDLDLDDVD